MLLPARVGGQRPAVEEAVFLGAGSIIFFKGVGEVLAAVVAGGKGDVGDAHGAVGEEKGGLLQTLAIDIFRDGAA